MAQDLSTRQSSKRDAVGAPAERLPAALRSCLVGDVLDGLGFKHQFLPPGLDPNYDHARIVGRAMPVLIGDAFSVPTRAFGLLTEALDQLEHGEVYVGVGGSTPAAAWGEILSVAARQRGATGAVIDGYHRDSQQIVELDFPVFSRGAHGADARVRSVVTAYRVAVEIGGIAIHPGELIIADRDGVLIVPTEVESEALGLAVEKLSKENLVLDAVRQGMSTTAAFERYGVL